ncbi:alpha/beta hydrolase [Nocardia sp. CDC159]|uniref:Alpha/beta hydrolase n=1 Tax=Nocardia pulmonis TaxID=2951408 RepID=A0A9X2E4Q1_9NOCA|nr:MULTISPECIES: alpha/beta hydrolase [Nocardia]MCM6773571.1 alpha/beta hydrolase [Nocardia pulmonis]MCM6786458.1 alpha/beta hydrolase [Nocardia sp. CDC159]
MKISGKRWLGAVFGALTVAAVAAGPATATPTPTIVLVHGAFADATSWDAVAAMLRADGYRVVVPDNPLRGPAIDAAAIERALDDVDGPVVLVGHSYGGVVITNVDDPRVRALVYVAAFAPGQGEPAQLALDPIRFPGSRLLPPALALEPSASGLEARVAPAHFRDVFAQDVGDATAADMIAHERTLALTANLEPSGPAAWTRLPSWYLVASEDRVIPPASQRQMAARMRAHTSEVSASHACLVSQPRVVATVVEQAAAQGESR